MPQTVPKRPMKGAVAPIEPKIATPACARRAAPASIRVRAEAARLAQAEQAKVHTMLVIGGRDMQAGAVSVRVHGKGNQGAKPRAEVVADLLLAIRERRA